MSVTGGVLTLTDAQANGVITNANVAALDHMMTGQTIDITGVPVADIAAFSALAAGLAGVTLHLEVTDTDHLGAGERSGPERGVIAHP